MRKFKEALCFDDVLLVPKSSDIKSRQEVDLTTNLSDLTFRLPIISSPMDTVTESAMALEMYRAGGLGIVHRYNTIDEQSEIILNIREEMEETSNENMCKISAAVGVGDDYWSRILRLYESGISILCIDVAHGHHSLVEAAIKRTKDRFGDNLKVIAGNVATSQGYRDLSQWGADAVRIGIGGGSICSTRIQTGHGVPTFQSVLDCSLIDGACLIADGGVKTSGDIVKALAAGADMVMLGSLLAGTDESPGSIMTAMDGTTSKIYRGMASVEAQVSWRGKASSLEGISTSIPHKGTARHVLRDLDQNIRSGLSYTGARTIREFQARSTFIKQTSSGLSESGTHILRK